MQPSADQQAQQPPVDPAYAPTRAVSTGNPTPPNAPTPDPYSSGPLPPLGPSQVSGDPYGAQSAPAFGAPAAYGSPPGYGQPFAAPGYGQPPYGQPPYGQPAYGPPGYPGYGVPIQRTNSKATTAMVLGILSLGMFALSGACLIILVIPAAICAIIALIIGIQARREIQQSNGTESGDGTALAGVIMGAIGVVLTVLAVIAGVVILIFALSSS